ncbi:MAG: redox-regulated ATPase YchF, partial [Candidatus Electrothrix sp. GM3_4]|nr:redox-regulated ATPase YchF [Candidatus Electrothrix sp. GM3_4]
GSQGEGLGNQFLGHIRQVDAILHVVRCFEDDNIIHVDGSVDPIRDLEVITMELVMSDLETVSKWHKKAASQAKSGDKKFIAEAAFLEQLQSLLDEGTPAKMMEAETDQQRELMRDLCLLTTKPVLYVANVSEEDIAKGNDFVERLKEVAAQEGASVVTIAGAIEQELSLLDDEEQQEFLADMGMEEPGLHRLIHAGYGLLGLITYFTVGVKETRAWTITEGTTGPGAAGKIHSDFERGFIRAEVISYEDYITCGSEPAARDKGLMRSEGKEYVVKDGDCILFRFNV